jgi:voltage-gated potassium channel
MMSEPVLSSSPLRISARNEELLEKFERVTLWPMMGLALASLVTLIVSWTLDLSDSMQTSLETFDWLIWAIFTIELLIRLYLSPKRLRFLWKNPIDVGVVLVPTLQGLRALRIARFARIWRLARVGQMGRRAIKEEKGLLNPTNAVFSILITAFVVGLAALMAWSVERDAAGSTIHTIPDAFWWAITTVTSVGYGDKIPVSPEGKAVAIVLMFMGVALFGAIAATLATVFIKSDSRKSDALLEHIWRLEAKLDAALAENQRRGNQQLRGPTDPAMGGSGPVLGALDGRAAGKPMESDRVSE